MISAGFVTTLFNPVVMTCIVQTVALRLGSACKDWTDYGFAVCKGSEWVTDADGYLVEVIEDWSTLKRLPS